MSDHWMTTYTGGKVVPAFVQPNQFHLLDIATALARTCRFNGHCREFYSVAQHSVILAAHMPTKELAREALLHDAPEAYLNDIVKPVKNELPDYNRLYEKFYAAIATRFGIPDTLSPEVIEGDLRMLATERVQLIRDQASSWTIDGVYDPYSYTIIPLDPKEAKQYYLGAIHTYFSEEDADLFLNQ
jgi:uncharacterized protein